MSLEYQDILCLPEQAFIRNVNPYSLILAVAGIRDFELLHQNTSIAFSAQKGLMFWKKYFHFTTVSCFCDINFKSTPCYCTRTRTWHLPYKGECQ